MPVLAAFALAKLKYGIAVVWTWLSHRTFWQLVCIALAVFAIVEHFELVHERKNSAAWQKRYTAEHAEMLKLSSAKNEQKAVTVDRIKIVHQKMSAANDKALVIEQAPPAKDCRTKPEIMGADL
jgi:hypothetical protein